MEPRPARVHATWKRHQSILRESTAPGLSSHRATKGVAARTLMNTSELSRKPPHPACWFDFETCKRCRCTCGCPGGLSAHGNCCGSMQRGAHHAGGLMGAFSDFLAPLAAWPTKGLDEAAKSRHRDRRNEECVSGGGILWCSACFGTFSRS